MTDKYGRMLYEAGDEDHGLQMVVEPGGDTIYCSATDEWSGSTETGFGATVTVQLTREDASDLLIFLAKWLEKEPE